VIVWATVKAVTDEHRLQPHRQKEDAEDEEDVVRAFRQDVREPEAEEPAEHLAPRLWSLRRGERHGPARLAAVQELRLGARTARNLRVQDPRARFHPARERKGVRARGRSSREAQRGKRIRVRVRQNLDGLDARPLAVERESSH
jgi:hypothetical protein